jgi:hypothetical protein
MTEQQSDVLRAAVAEATAGSAGVAVKAETGEGSPAQLLLDAARGASMVWSAAAATAGSPGGSWARSARPWPSTRRARC